MYAILSRSEQVKPELKASCLAFSPERMVNLAALSMYDSRHSQTESQSGSQHRSSSVKEELSCRDGDDVFRMVSSLEDDLWNSQAAHIIPHARGDKIRQPRLARFLPISVSFQWMKLIVQSRPQEVDDDLQDLENINDIRNEFLASPALNGAMSRATCSVMVVSILNSKDILFDLMDDSY